MTRRFDNFFQRQFGLDLPFLSRLTRGQPDRAEFDHVMRTIDGWANRVTEAIHVQQKGWQVAEIQHGFSGGPLIFPTPPGYQGYRVTLIGSKAESASNDLTVRVNLNATSVYRGFISRFIGDNTTTHTNFSTATTARIGTWSVWPRGFCQFSLMHQVLPDSTIGIERDWSLSAESSSGGSLNNAQSWTKTGGGVFFGVGNEQSIESFRIWTVNGVDLNNTTYVLEVFDQ